MKLQVGDEQIHFDDVSVRFIRAYVEPSRFPGIFREWARRLSQTARQKLVYLPFCIDDECVDALEARLDGEYLTCTLVRLDCGGYVPGVDDFWDALLSAKKVLHRYPHEILKCKRDDLVGAVAEWLSLARNDGS